MPMMYEEFEALMNERAGWSFTRSTYESIIEPVYNVVREDKPEFVDYCIKYDLNGLQRLANHMFFLEQCSNAGLTIWQTHSMVRLFEAQARENKVLYARIAELNSSLFKQRVTLREIARLSGGGA